MDIIKLDINKRILEIEDINSNIKNNPEGYVYYENKRYSENVRVVAEFLASGKSAHRFIFLSGPSSAGKTTTANKLAEELSKFDIDPHVVSMDNFYRGQGKAPILENGEHDYESIDAIRLDRLEQSIVEILEKGETLLPIYDFNSGAPSDEKKYLKVSENSVLIFEGIHAINPHFEKFVPGDSMFKLFVNTITPFYKHDLKVIRRRDIRLIRRILRDSMFRNSPAEATMDMWPQVARGENEYMFPYVDTVDFVIDTTHGYEPCLFAPLVIPILEELPKDSKHKETVKRLLKILSRFEEMDTDLVPQNGLMREFIGGGIYEC